MDGGDELFADFRQYYGLDLYAMIDGGEFGEINTLTKQLPPESRTLKRLHPELEWSEGTYILALIADQLASIAYGMSSKGKKPKPLPRPKAKKTNKKNTTPLNLGKRRVDALLFAPRTPTASAGTEEGGQKG